MALLTAPASHDRHFEKQIHPCLRFWHNTAGHCPQSLRSHAHGWARALIFMHDLAPLTTMAQRGKGEIAHLRLCAICDFHFIGGSWHLRFHNLLSMVLRTQKKHIQCAKEACPMRKKHIWCTKDAHPAHKKCTFDAQKMHIQCTKDAEQVQQACILLSS